VGAPVGGTDQPLGNGDGQRLGQRRDEGDDPLRPPRERDGVAEVIGRHGSDVAPVLTTDLEERVGNLAE
jgi:hypothetical protein